MLPSAFPRDHSLLPDTFNNRLHLVNSIHHYSLRDFIDIDNGTLGVFVKQATNTLINHIFSCEVRAFPRAAGWRPRPPPPFVSLLT